MLREFAWQFLLPPNGLVTLAAIAAAWAWFTSRGRRLAAGLAFASLAALAVLLSPQVTGWLIDHLETAAGAPVTPARLRLVLSQADAPQAIVVLGGGMREDAREPSGRFALSARTLERLRHGARLARDSSLPILVSGGSPRGHALTEGELMAQALATDFGVPARWVENRSFNTAQNGAFSAQILAEAGIDRVLLVTHAYHMPRASAVFEAAGLSVVPAPMAYLAGAGTAPGWLRSGVFDDRLWLACHEFVGLLWYRWRGHL